MNFIYTINSKKILVRLSSPPPRRGKPQGLAAPFPTKSANFAGTPRPLCLRSKLLLCKSSDLRRRLPPVHDARGSLLYATGIYFGLPFQKSARLMPCRFLLLFRKLHKDVDVRASMLSVPLCFFVRITRSLRRRRPSEFPLEYSLLSTADESRWQRLR